MAKRTSNIFPKLRGLMAERNESVNELCTVLNISDDSLRRSLKGGREFTLSEVITLADRYGIAIDELFKKDSD